MPIPSPKSNENKDTYISRCVSEISGEYPQDQSLAICISKWSEEKFKAYPFQKCMSDNMKRGYSVRTAERICDWIKKQY